MELRAIVISPYVAQYADTITLRAFDAVEVHRTDAEYPGWYWCTSNGGMSGWVHASYLSGTVGTIAAIRDYSAHELTVEVGERGRVMERLGGWVFVELSDGRVGWVPEVHVQVAV